MADLPSSRKSHDHRQQGPGGSSRGSLASLLPRRLTLAVSGGDPPADGASVLPGITTEIDPSEITLGERLGGGTYGEVFAGRHARWRSDRIELTQSAAVVARPWLSRCFA